jgi:hypothetical protein
MNRGKIRTYALPILTALAAVSMFPSFGGGSEKGPPTAQAERTRYVATDCGTIASTSAYPLARVTALRGVGCARALDVAKAYDKGGKQLGAWHCALAHGGGTDLFSCGKGGHRGNLRKWPHALAAKGESAPTG